MVATDYIMRMSVSVLTRMLFSRLSTRTIRHWDWHRKSFSLTTRSSMLLYATKFLSRLEATRQCLEQLCDTTAAVPVDAQATIAQFADAFGERPTATRLLNLSRIIDLFLTDSQRTGTHDISAPSLAWRKNVELFPELVSCWHSFAYNTCHARLILVLLF